MNPFGCRFCNNRFKKEKSRDKHEKKCSKNPKHRNGYKCPLCEEKGITKYLANYDSFLAHKKNIHSGPRMFECEDCNSKYKYEWYLAKHKKTCKGNFIRAQNSCAEMSQSFRSQKTVVLIVFYTLKLV